VGNQKAEQTWISISKCIYTFEYKPRKLLHGNKQFLAVGIFKTDGPISKFFKDMVNVGSQYSYKSRWKPFY
jgi:hypothetical protein